MKLNWHAAETPQVIDALRKGGASPVFGLPYPTEGLPRLVQYAVSEDRSVRDRRAKIVLLGEESKEFFSWASTYAEDVFPVSMSARIMLSSDWYALEFDRCSEIFDFKKSTVWASIVLGELLGQSQGEIDVASAPIGRIPACFSYAIARAALLYPESRTASTIVAKRLTSLDIGGRFARRPLGPESLFSVCSVYSQLSHLPSEDLASPSIIIDLLGAVNREAAALLRSFKPLVSDFAEYRVEGFDLLVDSLLSRRHRDEWDSAERVAPTLAAAAILVGRGTSHLQLLAPFARDLPQVFGWFGMFAGLLGQDSWDLAWTRCAKSVDRMLRQPFRIDEPVRADLCWSEFEWLTQMFGSDDVFAQLPRSAPRSLIVEVLPGVEFQLRLTSRESATEPASAVSSPAISTKALDEALKLIEAAHWVLRGGPPNVQPDLFNIERPPSVPTKKARAAGTTPRGAKQKS